MPQAKGRKGGLKQPAPAAPTVTTAEAPLDAAKQPVISNAKARAAAKKKAKRQAQRSFKQSRSTVGLVVTDELETAIERCKAKVASIAKTCIAQNRKFRDVEFDLENDKTLCLQGLVDPEEGEKLNPADVMRVGDIWDQPSFFKDGASSSDVAQGSLGDCWFLSAIANVASIPGLIEKICVARDETVGVYGFIFFRDDRWIDVVIDDQLYVKVPKYESLTPDEQKLYHGDPDLYNDVARKGSKILYFARGQTEGETWVPLIEKAYAKAHGNYTYIIGGRSMEGVEDLTGGVCHTVPLVDILDKNRLWAELCQHTNKSKLYGVSLSGIDNARSLDTANRIHGLVTGHAYTVLRAIEYNGKRFVLIRNPWGTGEWKGRWSDGSKEWTSEWLPALAHIGHSFGNDGTFIMEYSDFLRHWTELDCTRLFDSSWAFSSIWVQVESLNSLHAWTWGDVSFTITVPEDSPAVIVLQQADDRYFQDISGYLGYGFDFVVFKKGSTEQYAASAPSETRWLRSTSCEVNLEAGDYVVHVRLDTMLVKLPNYLEELSTKWSARQAKRVRAKQAEAYARSSNFRMREWDDVIPTSLETVAGFDLTELEINLLEAKRVAAREQRSLLSGQVASATNGDVTMQAPEGEGTEEPAAAINSEEAETDDEEEAAPVEQPAEAEAPAVSTEETTETTAEPSAEAQTTIVHENIICDMCRVDPIVGTRYKCASEECPDYDLCGACFEKKEHDQSHEMLAIRTPRPIPDMRPQHYIICNICRKGPPVYGTRYKCVDPACEDFDMCEECMDGANQVVENHNPTHTMLKIPVPAMQEEEEQQEQESGPPAAHPGIFCDGCRRDPIIGSRFKCMDPQCPSYDLCEDCMQKGIHPASHQMLRIDSPEEARHLTPSMAGATFTLGLRVYTLKSSKSVLGAQLKHGSLRV